MWGYILTLLIGVAIPLIVFWLQDKQKEKYFELERKEKFKMVAIEKRLEAHQQALKLWDDLRSFIHSPDSDPDKMFVLTTARNFWYSNSLFLEKDSREQFEKAFWIVSNYRLWLENWKLTQPGKEKDEARDFYQARWEEFHKTPEIIQKEVELEPIKPREDKTPEGEEIKKSKG